MIRIAFDVGGVLSKYPDVFRPLFLALVNAPGIEVHVISDMHPRQKVIDMCRDNGFLLEGWDNEEDRRVHSADYQRSLMGDKQCRFGKQNGALNESSSRITIIGLVCCNNRA